MSSNSSNPGRYPPGRGPIPGLRNALTLAASSPYALYLLAFCAFLDALILPLPLSVLLVPLCALAPHKTGRALMTTVLTGQLGAALSFLLGYYLCPLILSLPQFKTLSADFAAACAFYSEHLAAIYALIYPLLPLPYCLGSLAAGLLSAPSDPQLTSAFPLTPLGLYLICSTPGRILRFALILGFMRTILLAFKALCERVHRGK